MPAMTLIRVPAAAYAALRCHAARFSTPGARHRDGSYTLAVAPELLEHLGSLALRNETLGATIVRVLQSTRGPEYVHRSEAEMSFDVAEDQLRIPPYADRKSDPE
jgi:hypothetical protein